jgi:hypothetical protein
MKLVHTPRFDGFLNGEEDLSSALARLGEAACPSGLNAEGLRALIMLTCQAHGVRVPGLDQPVTEATLDSLGKIAVAHRTGTDTFKLV